VPQSERSVDPAGAGSALLAGRAPRLKSGHHAGAICAAGSAAWYYYSPESSRAAQISWHGRPARAHGQDGRATLGCGSAALW
jgi:hypothetical protein